MGISDSCPVTPGRLVSQPQEGLQAILRRRIKSANQKTKEAEERGTTRTAAAGDLSKSELEHGFRDR